MKNPRHLSIALAIAGAAALTVDASAQIVWTGASGSGIFRESNWDLTASTVTVIDHMVPIADDVHIIGPGVEPRIPDLPGQEAFTVADGFHLLIDNIRVYVAGNDGIGGEAGGSFGITVDVVNGGLLETYFVRNNTMIDIDHTSEVSFRDPANPLNGSYVNMTLGSTLKFLLETPDDFRNEHLSRITVDGMPAIEGTNIVIEDLGTQGCEIVVLPGAIGTNYCTANVNSTGQAAAMTAAGSQTAAVNSLAISCEQMPNLVFGFFIVSQTAGFAANPGGSSGNLCLGGSVGRFVGPGEIQNSGLDGMIDLDVDLTAIPQPTGPAAAAAGGTWRFQCWFRDSSGTSTPTSNFSDGIAVLLL